MKITLLAIGVFIASSAFGQQSTTDTTCNVNGQQVNCTSNTTSTGSTDAQRAEQQREMSEAGKAIGAAVGSAIGNKILKHRINKWCEGHPDGSWNFANGQNVTCFNWNEAYQPAANAQLKVQLTDQRLTIAVASWMYCKAHPDQSWTGPISGKDTPCGQLIALDEAACSRNPGLDYCKAIAATASSGPTPAPATAAAAVVSSPPSALAPVALSSDASAPPGIAPGTVGEENSETLGTIFLNSNPPEAEVYIDDSFIGKAPVSLVVKPGQHSVRAFAKDYQNWSQWITIAAGSEVRITATLKKSN
jgi:PEGA domain-containing protein